MSAGFFVLSFLGKLFRTSGLSLYIPIDLYIVLAVLLCIAAGQLMYVTIERPLVSFLQNKKTLKTFLTAS